MTRELKIRLSNTFSLLNLKEQNVDVFIEYINTLTYWNKNINLISKKEKNPIDNILSTSLLFFKVTDSVGFEKIVDIGSGAGFPGMVIKIYNPALDMTMIEKNRKKCAFLRYVNKRLNMDCKIINKNVYELNESEIDYADVVTVRGISLKKENIEEIKKKTKGKYLIYFTSPTIALPLVLLKKVEFNTISAQLYEL